MVAINFKRLTKAVGIVFGCILLGIVIVYILGLISLYLTFEIFFWSVIVAFVLWAIGMAYMILGDENI